MNNRTAQRTAEWSHWGITFFWQVAGQYAPAKIEGILYFPVSSRGPCDIDRRAEYIAAIKDWRETGTLPTGITIS